MILTETCTKCGQSFDYDDYGLTEYQLGIRRKVCQPCSDSHNQRVTFRRRVEQDVEAYRSFAEMYYRNVDKTKVVSDLRKLPRPDLYRRVLAWKFGPRGLLLKGETGLGKTRAANALLAKWAVQGKQICTVKAVTLERYSYWSGEQNERKRARELMEDMIACDLLLLDDVFQHTLTEAVQRLLFIVIDEREGRRPFIVTTNENSESLRGRITGTRANPFIRRLAESCDVITFAKPTQGRILQ